VKGRWAGTLLLLALGVAIVLQGARARDRVRAGQILRAVEVMTQTFAAERRLSAPIVWRHVRLLEEAERLDPADAAVPLARGTQLLLLQRPEEATGAFERAIALEPRPETFLHLARAYDLLGREDDALASYTRALGLYPQFLGRVPGPYRERLPPLSVVGPLPVGPGGEPGPPS
jgi:tetratricopeptide (TPR) repeat protein